MAERKLRLKKLYKRFFAVLFADSREKAVERIGKSRAYFVSVYKDRHCQRKYYQCSRAA